MNTHTIVVKCRNFVIPEGQQLRNVISKILESPQIDYFARNGKRLYSNPRAIMESLNDTLLITISFRHLLQLDARHSFAVIREALRSGLIKTVSRQNHEIELVLN